MHIFQSKRRTKDRAIQYAQGLKQYFYEGRPPVEVADIIVKYGPDKLRRVAQRRAQLIVGAQEWAKNGKDPRSPSFDEVLAELLEKEKKAKSTAEDESPDTDGRALPPDGSMMKFLKPTGLLRPRLMLKRTKTKIRPAPWMERTMVAVR